MPAHHNGPVSSNVRPQNPPPWSTPPFVNTMPALFILYTIASFTHFSHNAEYIAFYPGLPIWMTRESVYLAWLAVASIGLLAIAARWQGWSRIAAILLVVYGLLGTDGLLHYTLALCSEHTFATNATIWAEVALGITLACSAGVRFSRLTIRRAATEA